MCETQVQYYVMFPLTCMYTIKNITVLVSDAVKINMSFKRICKNINLTPKKIIFTTGLCSNTCICNTWKNLKIILMHYESPVKKINK